MPDPNYLVLNNRKLILMLICKAGNTSLKRAMASALCISPNDSARHRDGRRDPYRELKIYFTVENRTEAWNLRECGYTVISVIRHPLARLVSCWAEKIDGVFHKPFLYTYGTRVGPGMPFDEWVEFVCSLRDEESDQHFRSMAYDLMTVDGKLMPEFIFKVEDVDWWKKLRALLIKRCDIDLGGESRLNSTGAGRNWQMYYNPRLLHMAGRRYKRDLEVFGYAVQ